MQQQSVAVVVLTGAVIGRIRFDIKRPLFHASDAINHTHTRCFIYVQKSVYLTSCKRHQQIQSVATYFQKKEKKSYHQTCQEEIIIKSGGFV